MKHVMEDLLIFANFRVCTCVCVSVRLSKMRLRDYGYKLTHPSVSCHKQRRAVSFLASGSVSPLFCPVILLF